MAATKKLEDSKRITVKVRRNERGYKGTIFAQTNIIKNGARKLVPFRFPENKEIDLPEEIIAHLNNRKVYVNTNDGTDAVWGTCVYASTTVEAGIIDLMLP